MRRSPTARLLVTVRCELYPDRCKSKLQALSSVLCEVWAETSWKRNSPLCQALTPEGQDAGISKRHLVLLRAALWFPFISRGRGLVQAPGLSGARAVALACIPHGVVLLEGVSWL